MNKKLNLFLSELNIPPKPIPTADNEALYDRLRENVLKMFSLQKHLKKKEIEKKRLEEVIETNKPKYESMIPPPVQTPVKSDEVVSSMYAEVGDKRRNPYVDKEKQPTAKKVKIT